MSTFKIFLKERAVKMDPAQWLKPNGQTGEARTSILRNIIANKEPLELVNGAKVVVTDAETTLKNLAQFEIDGKTFDLVTDKGIIKSNEVGKSKVFGGGGGAGGGTDQTAIAEPQTCVYIQAMLDNGVMAQDFFRKEEVLRDAFAKCEVGKTSIDDIIALGDDDSWHMSAYLSAKAVIEKGYVKKGMVLHRDSNDMNAIYAAMKNAFANSKLSPMTNDKWNPGDIWAIAKGWRIADLDVSSISDLNKDLLGLFNARKVVGISLKKVKNVANIVEMNIEQPPQTESFRIRALYLKGKTRGTVWSSKSGSVEYDNGVIEIRPNSYMGSNKMELQGKGARGGSAGWQVIQNAAFTHLGKKMPEHGDLKKMAVRISRGDKRSTAVFHGMLNSIEAIPLSEVETQLKDKKGAGDPGWLTAKLGAVYIMYYLNKFKGTKANNFITAIVNYAGSKSEESGPYIIVKA
jgi:hypothetical protein